MSMDNESLKRYVANSESLKVGDRVRILPRQPGQEAIKPMYTRDMTHYAGDLATVRRVRESGHIEVSRNGYVWNKDWLERV